jgi:hypothetical protein
VLLSRGGGGGGMTLCEKTTETLLFKEFAEAGIALVPHLLFLLLMVSLLFPEFLTRLPYPLSSLFHEQLPHAL